MLNREYVVEDVYLVVDVVYEFCLLHFRVYRVLLSCMLIQRQIQRDLVEFFEFEKHFSILHQRRIQRFSNGHIVRNLKWLHKKSYLFLFLAIKNVQLLQIL